LPRPSFSCTVPPRRRARGFYRVGNVRIVAVAATAAAQAGGMLKPACYWIESEGSAYLRWNYGTVAVVRPDGEIYLSPGAIRVSVLPPQATPESAGAWRSEPWSRGAPLPEPVAGKALGGLGESASRCRRGRRGHLRGRMQWRRVARAKTPWASMCRAVSGESLCFWRARRAFVVLEPCNGCWRIWHW
jgi:hypothetical protein